MTNLTRELNSQSYKKVYEKFRHMKKTQLFLYTTCLIVLALTVIDLVAFAVKLILS